MEMNENSYTQISGTLDYGLLNSKAFIRLMWALIVIGIVGCLIFTVGAIAAKEPLLIIAVILCPLLYCSLGGYFLIREREHIKLIELWCEDAVEHVAYTEKVYCVNDQILYTKNNQPYILKVKVNYKNQKHTYFSLSNEKSAFDSFFLKNCSYHGKMVAKYGGGKVKILYSPKYNKVMFLKGEKPKIDETAEIE